MNKYNARKVTYYGQTFDSVKEGQRWLLLRDMEKRKQISDLRRQIEVLQMCEEEKLDDLGEGNRSAYRGQR